MLSEGENKIFLPPYLIIFFQSLKKYYFSYSCLSFFTINICSFFCYPQSLNFSEFVDLNMKLVSCIVLYFPHFSYLEHFTFEEVPYYLQHRHFGNIFTLSHSYHKGSLWYLSLLHSYVMFQCVCVCASPWINIKSLCNDLTWLKQYDEYDQG